ncbi:FAD-dependent oxidoreductase [Streptomyces sp. 3N207]|uniref:FAD-dependent oxidoreductase n=1 Tax=Streptomyces sp. 3N207 TaxID=3457417 RepID=UPI003FD69F44
MERRTAAVIGGGISGLTAAHVLQQQYDVTLFEAASNLGGHADTHRIAGQSIDMGFIIYSELYYPMVTRLFKELGVETQPADLVVDVVCDDCGFAHLAGGVLGMENWPTRPQPVQERTWDAFERDCARFPADLMTIMAGEGTGPAVGELLQAGEYSSYFADHFLYPRTGSLFLQAPRHIDHMPVKSLGGTLSRYELMGPDALASWRTVTGGSRRYVDALATKLSRIHTASPVAGVSRDGDGVLITDGDGIPHTFHKAVIATHAPEALRMLSAPTSHQRTALEPFEYAPLEAAIHTDTTVLKGSADSSNTVLHVSCSEPESSFRATYRAGLVHKLGTEAHHYLCSNNMTDRIDPKDVLCTVQYEHPVVTAESTTAQQQLTQLSDETLAFAGAYFGDGFHEAGCRSGALAAERLGVRWTALQQE